MPPANAFVDFVLEQLALAGTVHARAMFGGHGIYADGVMFALIAGERLYFKSDRATHVEFERLGLTRFSYHARGKRVELDYFEAPPEVFEDRDAMRQWAQRAGAVALRARARR